MNFHATIAVTIDTYSHVLPGIGARLAKLWKTLWSSSFSGSLDGASVVTGVKLRVT
jgi:hypothetical protein